MGDTPEQEVDPVGDRPVDAIDASYLNACRFNEIGRHDLAEREIHKVLAAWPDDAPSHVQLALAHMGQDRLDEAERAALEALRLGPEQGAFARLVLGELYCDQGRHRESERILLEALHADPEDAVAYQLYGFLMWKTGRLEKAEALVGEAIRIDPEYAAAHSLLGAIRAQRRAPDAVHRAGKGLELEPDSDVSHAAMGYTCLQRGRPFAARRHLREALRLDPSDSDLEQAWLQADRCCRWLYLPMYYWSLLVTRLPGQQFAIWALVIGSLLAMNAAGAPGGLSGAVALAYLLLVVYTWIADPLVDRWLRLRPPR